MATSGSWNYSLTAADVIKAAYEDTGIIQPGQSVSTADSTMALTRLNILAKQLQGGIDGSMGIPLFTRQRITLFLAKGQQKYLIGPATTDSRSATSYGRTTISASEAAGQTTISITSNTDTTTDPGTTVTMTSGDFVGIQLDDGTLQWTTISGTPASTMNISDALTSASAAGNYVYWFTSRAQRFPTIEAAVLRNSSLTDTGLYIYRDVQQYALGVADKYADGDPSALLIEPQTLNTRVILDSQPTDVTKQVVMTVLYPQEDYDATTDDIAFPQEAYGFLMWELAFMLSPSIGKWTPEMEGNRQRARQIWMNMNPETTSISFHTGGV